MMPSAPAASAAVAVSTERTSAAVTYGRCPHRANMAVHSRTSLPGSPPNSLTGSQNGST